MAPSGSNRMLGSKCIIPGLHDELLGALCSFASIGTEERKYHRTGLESVRMFMVQLGRVLTLCTRAFIAALMSSNPVRARGEVR